MTTMLPRCLRLAGTAALAVMAGALLPSASPDAWSQETRTITIVVPFPQGGGSDALARLVAQYIDREQRHVVQVENHPGATALPATEAAARAAPDGNTILIAANSFVITPLLRKVNYDPLSGFEPVCLLTRTPNVIVVTGASDYRSLTDLVGAARAKSGQLAMAFQGRGSSQHIAFEKLKRAAGITMASALFPTPDAASSALLSGQAAALVVAYPAVMEHVKAGRMRVLAVASGARAVSMPDIPTIAEAEFDGVDEDVWFGLMAPTGTPKDTTAKLAAWFSAAMMIPETKAKLAAFEIHPVGLCGADFATDLKRQHADYGRIIQEANLATE